MRERSNTRGGFRGGWEGDGRGKSAARRAMRPKLSAPPLQVNASCANIC